MSTGVGGFAGLPQSQHQGQSPCQEEREVVGVESVQQDL